MNDPDAASDAAGGLLDVPGARLFYRRTGSGPALLMIPGSPSDSYDFVSIVPMLADRYTVLTYDWRGFSSSSLTGPPADLSLAMLTDDAYRLLAATGSGPAYVFGSSAGGLVALDLLAEHPDQVRAVVAHEPPATELLAGTDPRRELGHQTYELYRRQGVGPAMRAFAAGLGFGGSPPVMDEEPPPELREVMARMREKVVRQQKNAEFFLAHVLRSITSLPDLAVLSELSARVTIAVGTDSVRQYAHDTGLALAERLGVTAAVFPGGHAGFLTHPAAFADKLSRVLR